MIEYTKYIADDGTEFDDYEECQEYERKMELDELAEEVMALNRYGKPVDNLRDTDSIFFLRIDSDEAAERLDNLCNGGWPWSYGGIRCIEYPRAGQFFYDTDIDRWIDIDAMKEIIKQAELYFEAR